MKDFVLIQNIRFNNRITLKTEISPNCVECLLPNFILQPIVENSIFHGIQPTSKPGVVMVKAVKENDTLIILIKDNGIGMTDQCLIQLKKDLCTQTNNIGINNVNQRLKMIYGTEYGLSISSDRNGGTTVTITLPYTDEKREESF